MKNRYFKAPPAILLPLLLLTTVSAATADAGPTQEEMEFVGPYIAAHGKIRGRQIEPHWFEDGDTFFFEDDSGAHYVDPSRKQMRPLRPEERERYQGEPEMPPGAVAAPGTGRWMEIREGDLWVHEASGEERRLTEDAGESSAWELAPDCWSPDAKRFLASRVDDSEVHRMPIIDYTLAKESVREIPYPKAGGGFPTAEIFVLDTTSGEKVAVETGAEEDVYIFPLGWREGGSEVLFLRLTRENKRLDLMAADPESGTSRVVVTEEQKTFVGGLDFLIWGWQDILTPIAGTDTFLWLSQRDGWRHVYLYDFDGKLLRRLTRGRFPVLSVEGVDAFKGRVFVMANAEKRLYDTHLYRLDLDSSDLDGSELDGGGWRRLTEGTGEHEVRLSPSKRFFIDSHSGVSRPPVSELRNVEGELLLELAQADTSSLDEVGWTPPEEFVVKAADGETDLYGVLFKPPNFDPEKRYPVIELIYAGPFIPVVPNSYAPEYEAMRAGWVAQLGYVTFLVDGRGTPERGKAFQDASYGRIGQIEIPDHVAALRQLAAERPYLDLERVGVYGRSWGGYFALRAMLTAPEVYHVGVAEASGDLEESQSINEPYLGLPQNNPEGYRAGSNPAAAANLEGHLLLIHGTADIGAPFSVTMRMVTALIEAGKLHDLAVVPQGGHLFEGARLRYAHRLALVHFEKHLGSTP